MKWNEINLRFFEIFIKSLKNLESFFSKRILMACLLYFL